MPVSKVKVTIDITSPFPTLNTVSIEGSTPIVDPYSVMGIVHELFPHFDEDEVNENTEIAFEKQAMKIIECASHQFIKGLASALVDYMPRSEDFKSLFNKELNKLTPRIDSLSFDSSKSNDNEKLESNLDVIFDDIVKNLREEEE